MAHIGNNVSDMKLRVYNNRGCAKSAFYRF